MRSIYASEQLSQVIWPDFINNFKSESSVGSYLSDINEFMDFIKKDFLILSAADVNNYYNEMKSKVANGDIQGNTMAKKINYPGASTQALCSAPTSPLTALAFLSCSRKIESGV